ncbi:MAG: hypothetical protein KAJ63_00805 [Methyloprofundus sp.]|nr:hypothetical protein [Methyloprofundus sp.]
MNKKLILGVLLLSYTALNTIASASTAIISFSGSTPLTLVVAGSFGWSFSTNDDKLGLTHLGLFDSGAAGFNEDHDMAIFDSSGSAVASVTFSATNSGVYDAATSHSYIALTAPAELQANSNYTIAAFRTSMDDDFIQSATDVMNSSGINYITALANTADDFLRVPGFEPNSDFQQGFFGPNFKYDIVKTPPPGVPAPDALILIFSGLGFLGIRKKSTELKA